MSKQKSSKRDGLLITTAGREVGLQPVSHVLLQQIPHVVEREFRERGELVSPPEYEVDVAGGGKETHTLNETTIEYPLELALKETDGDEEAAKKLAEERTEENRVVWQAHKEAVARMEEETAERNVAFMLEDGLAWEGEVPDTWIAKQTRRGFILPDDEDELRLFYVLRALLITPADQVGAMTKIMALSAEGVDNDLIRGAEDFFRAQLEGTVSAEEPAETEGAGLVEGEPAMDGS